MTNNGNSNIINDVKLSLIVLIYLFINKIIYMSQITYLFSCEIIFIYPNY